MLARIVADLCGHPRPWLGPALMTNLVVSMAGEAYDADEQRVQIGNPG